MHIYSMLLLYWECAVMYNRFIMNLQTNESFNCKFTFYLQLMQIYSTILLYCKCVVIYNRFMKLFVHSFELLGIFQLFGSILKSNIGTSGQKFINMYMGIIS